MLTSIPQVADVEIIRGEHAAPEPDTLFEVAHGATETSDYEVLATRLTSPLPPHLHEFFHVNTDTGAWELARAIADELVGLRPTRTVAVIRCRLPRTFIDTNRLLDAAAGELAQGGVTPGIPPYVSTVEDHDLLRGLHARYQALVDQAVEALPPEAALVFAHTYAPRTVGIERIDGHIVEELRRAYAPGVDDTWPMRPEVDLITRTPDGTRVVDSALVDRLHGALVALGREVAEAQSYTLHPATQAARRALERPGRALCFEVRRDLLVERWTPLRPLKVDPAKVAPLARAFAHAMAPWI